MNQMFGILCISRQDTPEVIKQTDTVSSVRSNISALRLHCWIPCNPHLFPPSLLLSRIQVLATVTRMPTLVRRTGTICHHANQTVATTPICSSFLTTSGKVAKHSAHFGVFTTISKHVFVLRTIAHVHQQHRSFPESRFSIFLIYTHVLSECW